jgi:hypothetical protein
MAPMLVGIYVDNTIPLSLDNFCEQLNALCKNVRFVAGESPFRLAVPVIASPSHDATLSAAILDETEEFDLTCLATYVPYDNNHFFDSTGQRTVVSFSDWNSLTDLPITNGFVYFIASILMQNLDIGSSHEENTGCVNDFLWNKTGVDIGMRAAFICGDCIGKQPLAGLEDIVADIQALLDAVSLASRADKDILQLSRALTANAEAPGGFDVFLCHNGDEKPAVRLINDAMKASGLKTWLDEEQLPPGLPWQPELERVIEQIRCACVFVGDTGMGPWQKNEVRAFLNHFDADSVPVIPVLLPGATNVPPLPIFLQDRTWIDLRENQKKSMERLLAFLATQGKSLNASG